MTEEGTRVSDSLRAGVAGGYEPPDMGSRNQVPFTAEPSPQPHCKTILYIGEKNGGGGAVSCQGLGVEFPQDHGDRRQLSFRTLMEHSGPL